MQWYYVENNDRKGPVSENELKSMISEGSLGANNYVWTKGFENWKKVQDVEQLNEEGTINAPFLLSTLKSSDKIIYIRTGADRGGVPADYGPFNLEVLKDLYAQNRINAKTLIFTKQLGGWTFLGDVEDFQECFQELPPEIKQDERRQNQRKPFVARMLMSDNSQVYEGICRDISVGGMQVLLAGFSGQAGDEISLNVHPENEDYHFVASGKIVRILDSGQGFSFRFVGLNSEAQEAIEKYLQEEN